MYKLTEEQIAKELRLKDHLLKCSKFSKSRHACNSCCHKELHSYSRDCLSETCFAGDFEKSVECKIIADQAGIVGGINVRQNKSGYL
jgi:hypothetical protein